ARNSVSAAGWNPASCSARHAPASRTIRDSSAAGSAWAWRRLSFIARFRQNTARAKILAAANHPEGDLGVDGVVGDAELLRDFTMREPVVFAQHEHFAAAVRQGA